MITFTNPRLNAYFEDWPLGGSRRGPCTFEVEHKAGKGYRLLRTTTGKPKIITFGGRVAIVDGSDGRTYILQEAGQYDFITVMRSDFIHAETLWPKDGDRYVQLESLIDRANALVDPQ